MKTLLPLFFVFACSGPPASATDEPDAAPAERAVYSLHFGPFQTLPGDEGVVCLDVPGPTEDVWVSGWRAVAKFVHHANVFTRTSGVPLKTATPCTGGASLGTGFFSTSTPLSVVRLGQAPEYAGVALKLATSSDLIWDVHYLNTTDQPAEATVDVDFYDAPDHTKELHGFNFNGGQYMGVPPGVTQTLTYTCPGPSIATSVLTAAAHVHAHDVAATLAFGGKEVYRSTDWASPLVSKFDSLNGGDVVVPAGSGATWSCEIANTTAVTLRYSNKIQTGEMCILSGFILGDLWTCTR